MWAIRAINADLSLSIQDSFIRVCNHFTVQNWGSKTGHANRNVHALPCIQQTYKNCQSVLQHIIPLHGSFCIEGGGSPRSWAVAEPTVRAAPSCNCKNTHTRLAPMCAFVVLSHLQKLHSSSSWYVPSSSSLRGAERQLKRRSKNQRSSTSKFVSTPVAIHHRLRALHSPQHTQTHTETRKAHGKPAERSRSIYRDLKCVPSCVVLRLTPTHRNMKRCVPREARRKNETHSDLLPQEYTGAKTVQFYTSISSKSDGLRQKTAL